MKKFLFLAAVLFAGCTAGNYTFTTQQGDKVRITPVNESIVRVTSVPQNASFPKDASLAVLPQNCKVKLAKTTAEDGSVSLSTAKVRIDISSEGLLTFTDIASGKTYTRESFRSFSPAEADGEKAWEVRQQFDSPQDEAFFGLGQHQADEWNYKGKNEELYQYNTKISIPFVVSSRSYGILWDACCFCRWGDSRPYSQLGEVFKLYDKNGEEGALTGTYIPQQGETLVRREPALAQEYLRTPQCDKVINSPENFKLNGSGVVFEGEIEAQESGIFKFLLYYSGYTKVFLDGEEIIPEVWRAAWNPNGRKFDYEMQKGQRSALRVEWQPDGNESYDALKVLSPLPQEEQEKMSWWGEMQDAIDYYFIAGDKIDDVISGYRTLTGKAQIMPKWALGYWLCRERYKTQDEIVGALRECRRRGIPVDNIVQDWHYWVKDQWGSHEFDPERYPDPAGMVDSIHAMDGRIMISVWPKFYEGTEHFNEMDSHGWIYRTAIDEDVRDWLGYRQSFYDAYSPEARKLFWSQMEEHLFPFGFDAWWMDASEPNVHDCTDMDFRKKMQGPTALGSASKYLNAYALENAQAIYEGQRSADPDRRVFLLTRNGFAGLQRYSTASWSGDIATRWEDMKAQISAGLNFSISGIPFWGQDIGGFSVENRYIGAVWNWENLGKVTPDLEEWRELQARWHEWGVFCPLYRSHGQWPGREPWNIAPEGSKAYEAILATDRMRYSMMPYIYSAAARVWFEDYTLMRPLAMDFTSDSKALNTGDEFLFGDALLVCPVCEYKARAREVYLPAGCAWYDFGDNFKRYEGGSTILAPAPFERIPLFGREGTILVEGEAVQSTAQQQNDLTISIFSGTDATFCLYEDEGTNYNYEKGLYCKTVLNWDEAASTLTIGKREGSFPGMAEKKAITVKLIKDGDFITRTAEYDGNAININF